jgi:hypothetical protein
MTTMRTAAGARGGRRISTDGSSTTERGASDLQGGQLIIAKNASINHHTARSSVRKLARRRREEDRQARMKSRCTCFDDGFS